MEHTDTLALGHSSGYPLDQGCTTQCEPMLECRGLGIRYGDTWAVRGVDLQLHHHEITALIGPSGCGKSSLLASMNRLTDFVADCAVEGDCQLCGESVFDARRDVTGLRRRIGMIFQQPNPFPLSIYRNIELPLREHGVGSSRERRAIIETVLTEVGLWDEVSDRLHDNAMQLSGGQQQRLCIARALAVKPEVLLMDEPCSALDPISSARVEELILSLRGRYTVLVVTHNMAQARRIADQVGFMWLVDGAGALVEHGNAEQVFGQPKHPLTAAYIQGLKG